VLSRVKKVFICYIQSCLGHSLGITPKWLPFVGQESGSFCWSNHAIFQEITTV